MRGARRWLTGDEAGWVTGFAVALHQGDAGVYVNFLGDEGAARVPRGLSGADLGPADGGQGPLRPDQPHPTQPEHPTGEGVRAAAGDGVDPGVAVAVVRKRPPLTSRRWGEPTELVAELLSGQGDLDE